MSRAIRPRPFLIWIFLLGASGCASAPPAVTYNLNAVEFAGTGAKARGALAVSTPAATSLIDSPRIVVRTGSGLAYLKGVQWSARLPELLRTRLIESFEKSHRLAAVGPVGLDTKWTLETDIRRFEADITRNTALVEIYVRLVTQGGQIVASQHFSAETPSPHDDGQTVSEALDQALAKVLRQIVTWTVPKV